MPSCCEGEFLREGRNFAGGGFYFLLVHRRGGSGADFGDTGRERGLAGVSLSCYARFLCTNILASGVPCLRRGEREREGLWGGAQRRGALRTLLADVQRIPGTYGEEQRFS